MFAGIHVDSVTTENVDMLETTTYSCPPDHDLIFSPSRPVAWVDSNLIMNAAGLSGANSSHLPAVNKSHGENNSETLLPGVYVPYGAYVKRLGGEDQTEDNVISNQERLDGEMNEPKYWESATVTRGQPIIRRDFDPSFDRSFPESNSSLADPRDTSALGNFTARFQGTCFLTGTNGKAGSTSEMEKPPSRENGSADVKDNSTRSRTSKPEKRIRRPRYAFQTRSQVDILDDGYRWRKYGQKSVKNNLYPRSYYRCTQQTCNVKKQVQRLSKDPGIVVTTYEGIHMHPSEKTMESFDHILNQMQFIPDF